MCFRYMLQNTKVRYYATHDNVEQQKAIRYDFVVKVSFVTGVAPRIGRYKMSDAPSIYTKCIMSISEVLLSLKTASS